MYCLPWADSCARKKQHIIDSIISFIGSAVTFTIFTFVMPYSVYQIIIRVIAPFQMIDIYYTFALPWLAVVISALTALFCAFMSSYIPFLMYKHTVNTVNAEYGGED